VGGATKVMRSELAEAVSGLFVSQRKEPQPLSDEEKTELNDTIELVVLLRGAVARDPRSKEIDVVYGAEGTARLGLTLERLLAGLDTLEVDRDTAFDVITRVAFDSVPPQRLSAYTYLLWDCNGEAATTSKIATALGLPTKTVRRRLEELAAYRVVKRISGDRGADEWQAQKRAVVLSDDGG